MINNIIYKIRNDKCPSNIYKKVKKFDIMKLWNEI